MSQLNPTKVIGIAVARWCRQETVSANLAVALAAASKKVMLFDADLGLANAQLALGCRTEYNFIMSSAAKGRKRYHYRWPYGRKTDSWV